MSTDLPEHKTSVWRATGLCGLVMPRSSFYAWRSAPTPSAPPGQRGPKVALDDDALLALIREDLAASPFNGEGHRKVFGRLRHVGGHALRDSKLP